MVTVNQTRKQVKQQRLAKTCWLTSEAGISLDTQWVYRLEVKKNTRLCTAARLLSC